jgi:Zn ribbon nucleic-acid-binding protein
MSDTLTDIADAAELLCDPRQHAEPRWEWDANRNRKILPPHRTTVPGLIQQLRDQAEPGVDGEAGGAGGAKSVPVAIDAVSLLASITLGAAMRAKAWGVNLDERTTPEEHIRGLVGLAGRRTSDEQLELRRELRSWAWQAEIITGWRTPPRELVAPCPQCAARGTLLAYAAEDNPRARCVGCGAAWAEIPQRDEGSIRILAEHVITYQRKAGTTMAAARAAAVADRRRREGRAA